MAVSGEAVLIVPGYRGSGESHWQSWLHRQLVGSRVLSGVSWHEPVLADWAERVREEIARAPAPLWIVAHSFGCLATVIAVADRPQNVAGVILAAPADPQRFHLLGLGRVDDRRLAVKTLADVLPAKALGVRGVLVASENDPWTSLPVAQQWADDWEVEIVNVGAAGHINAESGFGPWPGVLDLLTALQGETTNTQASATSVPQHMQRGRGSALARVRRHTREQLGLLGALS
ncbi:MAG: alpha/beta hydrolase [Pseudomonadota bacterium]